jgi:Ser/Thr protein kinase RdoA (MazF antagonist)
MAGEWDRAATEAWAEALRGAAGAWGLSADTRLTLLNVSENATFRADDPAAEAPLVLRIHRPGYHSRPEIESERAWIAALRAEGVVDTPAPVPAQGGAALAALEREGQTRYAAAFAFMDGAEPALDGDLTDGFDALGAICARLHGHARRWRRPPGFTRKRWDWETTVGPSPHWGDWRRAPGLEPEGAAVIDRACAGLRARLAAFGAGPERFGLIHADLRPANLLADGPRLGVIDFDDCGFGWFLYDFAAAVSFFEHDPRVSALAQAWAEGYRRVAPLPEAEAAMLPCFVLLRRILLTAWIASHAETPLAQAMGPAYTAGTVALCERWLGA